MCNLGIAKTGCTDPDNLKHFQKTVATVRNGQSRTVTRRLVQTQRVREIETLSSCRKVVKDKGEGGMGTARGRRGPGPVSSGQSAPDSQLPPWHYRQKWVNEWNRNPLNPKGGSGQGRESPDCLRAVLIHQGNWLMCQESIYLCSPALTVCPTVGFCYKLGLVFYKSPE